MARRVLATESCGCPLPIRVVVSIAGRTDDALVLPAQGGGTIRVHPVVFRQALELVASQGRRTTSSGTADNVDR